MKFDPKGVLGQGEAGSAARRSIRELIRLSFRTILRNQLRFRTNGQARNPSMPDVLDSQIKLTMFVFDRTLTRLLKEQCATSGMDHTGRPYASGR